MPSTRIEKQGQQGATKGVGLNEAGWSAGRLLPTAERERGGFVMLHHMKSRVADLITLILIFSFAFAIRLGLALEMMR